MCKASGYVLSSMEVQTLLVSFCGKAALAEANYIQTEHPALGTPFVTLHICGMDDILSLLRDGSDDPLLLLKWFSVVAPYVGISLTPAFYNSIATEIQANKD